MLTSRWCVLHRHHHQPTINRKLDAIMASLDALNAAVGQISTDVSGAVTALNDLATKLGSGDMISQSDIDAITAKLVSASTSLDAAVASDDPAPAPADPPVDPAPVDPPVDPAPVDPAPADPAA